MISLTPGFGDFRDGITTRNADNLDAENSVIYSLSNQSGTDLEILGPKNEDVGLYRLFLKAKDQSGESVTADFMINVKNVNESPILKEKVLPNILNFLEKQRYENSNDISQIFELFSDSDLINSDKLDLDLILENNNDPILFNTILMQSDNQGNLKIQLKAPEV